MVSSVPVRLIRACALLTLSVALSACSETRSLEQEDTSTLKVSVGALSEDLEIDLAAGTYEVSASGTVTDGIALVDLTIRDILAERLISTFNLSYNAEDVGAEEGDEGSAPPVTVVLSSGQTGSADLDFVWAAGAGDSVDSGVDFSVNFESEADAPNITAMVATNIGETTTDDIIHVFVSTETATTEPLFGVVQILDGLGVVVRESVLTAIPESEQLSGLISAPPVRGDHTLRAVVTDTNGNSTTASKTFQVELGTFKEFAALGDVSGPTLEVFEAVETTFLDGTTMTTRDGAFIGEGVVQIGEQPVLFEIGPNNILLEVGDFIFSMSDDEPGVVQTDFDQIAFETFIGDAIEQMGTLPFEEWTAQTVAYSALAAVGMSDVALTNIAIAQVQGLFALGWCELGVIAAAAVVSGLVAGLSGAACASICAVGTVVSIGSLTIPCAAIITFCTTGAGAAAYAVLHDVLLDAWSPPGE